MRYIILMLVFATQVAWAGTANDIITTDKRGPWFDTIDEDARDYAYNRVTEPVQRIRKGPSALRFELRHGDCYTAVPEAPETGWDDCTRDRERTEVREKWKPPLDTEVWYAFSLYIPFNYEWMYPKQMFFQWHGGVWGPNAFFQLKRDQFFIDILTEEHTTTTQYNPPRLRRGRWYDFEVKVKWSKYDSGYFYVFQNGDLIVEHKGATMDAATYDTGEAPHVKYGIYRSHTFRWTEERDRPTHVLYFDEYRHGFSRDDVALENNEGN